MPLTFMVVIVIFESGMFGSMGAVASIVIVPVKPEHWARPFMSTLTPAGTGCVENGFPIDHRTGVIAIMGSMLKFPVAVNCTMPLEFFASAEAEFNINTVAQASGIELPVAKPLLHFSRNLEVLVWWPEKL